MKDNFEEKIQNKNEKYQKIYCISCFNKFIWENNLYKLGSNNAEIISVKTISQNNLICDENFKISIHQIDLSQRLKKLNLILSNKDKEWKLNEITISKENDKDKDKDKDNNIILFVDIDINPSFLSDLLNDLKSNCANEKIDKISRNLETNEKLDIYLNYFNQNKEILENVKLNLVKQFIRKTKDDENKSFFSSFVKIFNLSFGTSAMVDFLKCYPNIDFKMDKFEDEEFENHVKNYEQDKNKFFSENNKAFQSGNDNSKVQK